MHLDFLMEQTQIYVPKKMQNSKAFWVNTKQFFPIIFNNLHFFSRNNTAMSIFCDISSTKVKTYGSLIPQIKRGCCKHTWATRKQMVLIIYIKSYLYWEFEKKI